MRLHSKMKVKVQIEVEVEVEVGSEAARPQLWVLRLRSV